MNTASPRTAWSIPLPFPPSSLAAAGRQLGTWTALTGLCLALGATESAALDPLRRVTLEDAFVLQGYRAGKASFVESPERHAGVWTETGFRYPLLALEGQGSLRHIWTTRGDGEPYFDWEFFVDGEATPSVRFTDEAMVRAAAAFPVPVAPANALPVHNRAFNFFLPVPFERSLRVEVVQRQPSFWLWFCQLDYRLEDDSLRGVRLFSEGEGENLAFSYVGLPQQLRERPASRLPREPLAFEARQVEPGASVTLAQLTGPGIVRELRLRWSAGGNPQLKVRFDGASSFAVESPAARFFGPFQGVSFFAHATNDHSCYLPMPFRERAEIVIENPGEETLDLTGHALVERVPAFSSGWGYFHARHQRTDLTDGHRPHQVLYVRGRGHWLGMTLYHTGHDHGGGDFAVIDGEGNDPAFLHGINGEDYFTFAWFGKGAHHPYAVAHSNDEGRYRHHFENVYPFRESFALEWGAFAGLSPESVAVWYQDTPVDTTVPDGARADSVEWDVFGPVPIPHDAAGRATGPLYDGLPRVAELDAGGQFECVLVKERFTSGWMKEWSVGPMLNLTYVARHGTKIDYEAELGGNGHAFLARRFMDSPAARTVRCRFAHDDPIELWVNGTRVYAGGQQFNGFTSTWVALPLRAGRNEVVVRLTNYFNRNFNWTGFLLRPEGARL
jgi:hypothetical protein